VKEFVPSPPHTPPWGGFFIPHRIQPNVYYPVSFSKKKAFKTKEIPVTGYWRKRIVT